MIVPRVLLALNYVYSNFDCDIEKLTPDMGLEPMTLRFLMDVSLKSLMLYRLS